MRLRKGGKLQPMVVKISNVSKEIGNLEFLSKISHVSLLA